MPVVAARESVLGDGPLQDVVGPEHLVDVHRGRIDRKTTGQPAVRQVEDLLEALHDGQDRARLGRDRPVDQ